MLRPLAFDHIVLNVRDVEKSVKFYHEMLGLEVDLTRFEKFKRGEAHFASVRVSQDTIIDLFPKPDLVHSEKEDTNKLNHFAIAFEKFNINELIKFLKEKGVKIIRGPVNLAGAKGKGDLINILDPDGNSIEVRHY